MRPMLLLGYANVRADRVGRIGTDHHCRIGEPPCAGLSRGLGLCLECRQFLPTNQIRGLLGMSTMG